MPYKWRAVSQGWGKKAEGTGGHPRRGGFHNTEVLANRKRGKEPRRNNLWDE